MQFPAEKIEAVCHAIAAHSFSAQIAPLTTEAKIVQDADRIDAIGAVGIARTFAFGGAKNRSLDDSLNHFDEKLLLLYDLLNTEAAKRIDLPRHQFLQAFYGQYKREKEVV